MMLSSLKMGWLSIQPIPIEVFAEPATEVENGMATDPARTSMATAFFERAAKVEDAMAIDPSETEPRECSQGCCRSC